MATKVKIEIEYQINASPKMLYRYFSTSSGLSEWFADDVVLRRKEHVFIWNGVEEKATMLLNHQDEKVRFHWVEDESEKTYFEFKIVVDEITQDISLIITDFSDEDEVEETKMFWNNQIETLRHVIGA